MRRLRKRHGLNLGGLRGTVGVSRAFAEEEARLADSEDVLLDLTEQEDTLGR